MDIRFTIAPTANNSREKEEDCTRIPSPRSPKNHLNARLGLFQALPITVTIQQLGTELHVGEKTLVYWESVPSTYCKEDGYMKSALNIKLQFAIN